MNRRERGGHETNDRGSKKMQRRGRYQWCPGVPGKKKEREAAKRKKRQKEKNREDAAKNNPAWAGLRKRRKKKRIRRGFTDI